MSIGIPINPGSFEEILKYAPFGVLLIDEEGIIEYINDPLTKMLGYKSSRDFDKKKINDIVSMDFQMIRGLINNKEERIEKVCILKSKDGLDLTFNSEFLRLGNKTLAFFRKLFAEESDDKNNNPDETSRNDLISLLPNIVLIADINGIVREVLDSGAQGSPFYIDLKHKPIVEFLPPDIALISKSKISKALCSKEKQSTFFTITHNDKTVFYEFNFIPFSKKQVSIKTSIGRDPSAILKTLNEREARLRGIIDSSTEGILLVDTNGMLIEWNNAMVELTGMQADEVLGLSVWEVQFLFGYRELSKNEKNERRELFKHLLKSGEIPPPYQNRQEHLQDSKGNSKHVSVSIFAIRAEDGFRLCAILKDTTNEQRMQELLTESEEKYRLLVDNQTDLIVKVNTLGEFQFVSPSYCKLFGKSEDDLIGKTFMPLVHEDDREKTAAQVKKVYKPPYTAYIEQRALTKDGWKWLGWVDTAILNNENEVVSIIGVGREITAQKEAELALRNSEAYFRKLIENSEDVIAVVDKDLKVLYESPSLERVIGIPGGKSFFTRGMELIHPDDRETVNQILEECFVNPENTYSALFRFMHTYGSWHYLEGTVKNMLHSPEINGIVFNFRDITERKLTEIELEDYRGKLELKVKERTAEIENKNKELEQFNNLFIGREFRIKELKDKVKELEAKLNGNN